MPRFPRALEILRAADLLELPRHLDAGALDEIAVRIGSGEDAGDEAAERVSRSLRVVCDRDVDADGRGEVAAPPSRRCRSRLDARECRFDVLRGRDRADHRAVGDTP